MTFKSSPPDYSSPQALEPGFQRQVPNYLVAWPVAKVSDRDQMTARIPGIGRAGIDAIEAAKVLVVGAGGIGSPVLAYLAAAGIGTIAISDPDRVDQSNLQRQVIHGANRVGQVKAESAAQSVLHLNPDINVVIEPKIEADTAAKIIEKYDLVVDATDNYQAKYLLSEVCAREGRPHFWATVVSLQFQMSVFANGVTLRDLYPQIPPVGTTPSSQQIGVLGGVCGQAGSALATEVIKWITGVGQPLVGKVLIVDTAVPSWNVLEFKKPGEPVSNEQKCSSSAPLVKTDSAKQPC